KKNGMIVVFLFSIFAIVLSGYNTFLLKTTRTSVNLPASNNFTKVTRAEVKKMIDNGAPYLGNLDAKVTVVEFADFQCPYCGKFQKEVYSVIKKDFIDTGKVLFVYMDFAFLGEESSLAAQAASCAKDQNKFWEYHDYLYDNQQGENRGAFSLENLKKFAVKLKLNIKDFNTCLDSGKYKKAVEDELNVGRTFGVKGTPSSFINDFFVNGVQNASYFSFKINEALGNK
ncbi:DsbA family protein, partial [Candidatus Nomurabacteria bacterium]|nr:DsbA family protein [Candidatus Nomurabacteria bacterium]